MVPEAERLDALWTSTLATHDALLTDWMDAERDIDQVLATPALFDVSDSFTASFLLALDTARDARGPGDRRPASAGAVEAYAASVRVLSTAWAAARRNARRVAYSAFTPTEVKTIERVRGLLNQAFYPGADANERHAYYRQARTLLDGLVDLPPAAVAELEQRVAGELPAGPILVDVAAAERRAAAQDL